MSTTTRVLATEPRLMLLDEALCNWNSEMEVGISFQITIPAIFDSICDMYESGDAEGRALALALREQCVETIARIDARCGGAS